MVVYKNSKVSSEHRHEPMINQQKVPKGAIEMMILDLVVACAMTLAVALPLGIAIGYVLKGKETKSTKTRVIRVSPYWTTEADDC